MAAKLEDIRDALEFHPDYDPEEKTCMHGNDWCTSSFYQAPKPRGSPSILIVWPAYWGMRLWLGLWGLFPRLFGRRIGVVIVDGKPNMVLMRSGK